MPDLRLLGVISAGGVTGTLGRYALQHAFPHGATAFGWATFLINVTGCLAIGIVVAAVTASERTHRLWRPFLVTGVLGGFTTFSTYIVDAQRALVGGAARTALLYAAATLLSALAAAWVGVRVGEVLFGSRDGEAVPSPEAAEFLGLVDSVDSPDSGESTESAESVGESA